MNKEQQKKGLTYAVIILIGIAAGVASAFLAEPWTVSS